MALEHIYSGKHIGNPVLKMIIEMSNEMDLITKKDMAKYIKDRKSGKMYFIQKPDGNVLTLSQRRMPNIVINPNSVMAYFVLVLDIPVETQYKLIDQDGNTITWNSFEPLIPRILYRVVHKDMIVSAIKSRSKSPSKSGSKSGSKPRSKSGSKSGSKPRSKSGSKSPSKSGSKSLTNSFMFKSRRSRKVRKSSRKSRKVRKSSRKLRKSSRKLRKVRKSSRKSRKVRK